jgi:hypothetical protein
MVRHVTWDGMEWGGYQLVLPWHISAAEWIGVGWDVMGCDGMAARWLCRS